nr:hypothetical protein [uncultured Flavonifractor sp.]
MIGKRFLCLAITCVIIAGCPDIFAKAVNEAETRATGKFSIEIPANTVAEAGTSFPLEAGEAVSIHAVYTPRTASVSFGLVAPDGYLYSIIASDGDFDKTITVDQKGYYTLAIRNRSLNTVNASGYINY